jgi:putative DNA primase/helicase
MSVAGARRRPSANGHGNGRRPADALQLYNLEAELGVIGSVLLDNARLGLVEWLEPRHFWRAAHAEAWRGALALVAEGRPADPITLADWMLVHSRDALGFDELGDACEKAVGGANLAQWAGIVLEKSRARELVELGGRLQADRFHVDTVERVLDELAGAVVRLGVGAGPGRRRRSFDLVRLADVEPEAMEFLWPGRIPVGKVTMLAGDPGLGKSFLTMLLASLVSTGGDWPDGAGSAPLGSVLVIQAEDGWGDTVRPRLDAAGADTTRIHGVRGIRLPDGSLSPYSLVRDLDALEEAADRLGDLRLVIIDPVTAYLGTKAEAESRNAEIRGVLGPLSDWAERRNVAVVMVTHLNKGSGTKAIYRATGSLAFIATARASWMISKDPKNPKRRLMLLAKANPFEETHGLAYSIRDGRVAFEPDPVYMGADEALEAEAEAKHEKKKRGPAPEKLEAAKHWIRTQLEMRGGRCRHGALRKEAEKQFAVGTFYDAKDALEAAGELEEVELEGERGKWFRLLGYEPPCTF